MRGEILALTVGDALLPVFDMLARAIAVRFEVEPNRVKAALETCEGKLVPSFGVPADVLAKANVSEDEAREFMRNVWAMARPLVQRTVRGTRERWHEFG